MINLEKLEEDYSFVTDHYQMLGVCNPDPLLANELAFKSIQVMSEMIDVQFSLSKEELKKESKTLTEARDYYYRKIKVMELIHQHSKQKYQEICNEINRKNV